MDHLAAEHFIEYEFVVSYCIVTRIRVSGHNNVNTVNIAICHFDQSGPFLVSAGKPFFRVKIIL